MLAAKTICRNLNHCKNSEFSQHYNGISQIGMTLDIKTFVLILDKKIPINNTDSHKAKMRI